MFLDHTQTDLIFVKRPNCVHCSYSLLFELIYQSNSSQKSKITTRPLRFNARENYSEENNSILLSG